MGQARRKDKNLEGGLEAPAPDASADVPPAFPRWEKPRGMSRRGWAVLGGLLVLFQFPLLHYFLLRGEAPVTAQVPYHQDYADPGVVASEYYSTGGHWRAVQGELVSPGVKNNPLWLQARLPENVAVEFDVRSESPQGDIKAEIFGDGTDHASGYVLIHGGWNNSLSIIARMDEHGPSMERLRQQATRVKESRGGSSDDLVATGVFREDTRMRVEANPFPVQQGRTYHWRIERRGSLLRWLIDGKPFMEFNDPFPLKGKGHDRFAFSSWESQLYFDNLRIEPL
ncbi:hypothetical protein P2318_27190 [Myxococcaceae bacterium GXIMD 01537]